MKKDFGILFWLHVAVICFCLSTPFWLDWKIVVIGALMLTLQYFLLGECYLTRLELGKGQIFWHYYLSKMFPHLNWKVTRIFVLYLLPLLIVVGVYVLQRVFGHTAIVSF